MVLNKFASFYLIDTGVDRLTRCTLGMLKTRVLQSWPMGAWVFTGFLWVSVGFGGF